MGHRVIGIGALNLDIIFGYKEGDEKLTIFSYGIDEEKVVDDAQWRKTLYECMNERNLYLSAGGSAANTVCALASLDPSLYVSYLSILGDDPEKERILEDESWELISNPLLLRSKTKGSTGRCISYIDCYNRRRIAVTEGGKGDFTVGDEEINHLAQFDWIHISPFASEPANHQIGAILEKVRDSKPKLKVSLDPGTILSRNGLKAPCTSILRNCDYLFLKRSELWSLGEQPDSSVMQEKKSREAARKIFEYSAQSLTIIVERIQDGFTVFSNREGFSCEDYPFKKEWSINPLKIVDDTGTGDVFDAAMIYGILNGYNYQKIAQLAQLITTNNLEHIGRRGYSEFQEALEKIRDATIGDYSSTTENYCNELSAKLNSQPIIIFKPKMTDSQIVIARSIYQNINKINSKELPQETKEYFEKLSSYIEEILDKLSEEQINRVKRDWDTLTEEITSKKPRNQLVRFCLESFIDVAKTVGEYGKPILDVASKLISLFS